MERDQLAQALRALLESQSVASLGTLHGGEPYVSMVPFTILPASADFIIHVSRLAAHTKDMLADARVSLMVMAAPNPDGPPQALARVTIQGDARQLVDPGSGREEAESAYLARFPESATTFELADFSTFAIRPRAVRFVGGFAQAKSFTPETLAAILAAP